MLSKDQLVRSMLHEIRIVKHLATKIPPGQARYRPHETQRSMHELMQYLTTCGIVPAVAAVSGNWDHAKEMEETSAEVTQQTFARAMDQQGRLLKKLIEGIPHKDLLQKDTHLPWGAPVKLGHALVEMALKPLVAYRMQLFLYVKASGRLDIGGAQCWVGVDPMPAPAEA